MTAVFGASRRSFPPERNFMWQDKNLSHAYVHEVGGTKASTFWAGLGAVRADASENGGRLRRALSASVD